MILWTMWDDAATSHRRVTSHLMILARVNNVCTTERVGLETNVFTLADLMLLRTLVV